MHNLQVCISPTWPTSTWPTPVRGVWRAPSARCSWTTSWGCCPSFRILFTVYVSSGLFMKYWFFEQNPFQTQSPPWITCKRISNRCGTLTSCRNLSKRISTSILHVWILLIIDLSIDFLASKSVELEPRPMPKDFSLNVTNSSNLAADFSRLHLKDCSATLDYSAARRRGEILKDTTVLATGQKALTPQFVKSKSGGGHRKTMSLGANVVTKGYVMYVSKL